MVLLVCGVVQSLKSKTGLLQDIAKRISVSPDDIKSFNVVRRSIDARKRRGGATNTTVDIKFVYINKNNKNDNS